MTTADRHREMRIAKLEDQRDIMEQRDELVWSNPIGLLERAIILLEDDTTRPAGRRERAIALVDEAIELLEADLQPA